MKNSLRIALTAGFMVVAFGLALTFCTSKTEKPVANGEDTLKTDKEVVVQNDTTSTETEPKEDTAITK